MAQIRWYLNNSLLDGWSLVDQTAAAAATITSGWVVGTGLTNSSEWNSGAGADRASTTFVGNTVPDGTLDLTLKDAFRSQFPQIGSFDAGNWTFQFAVVSTVQSGAADGQIVFRVLKADADGSNATQITTGQVATTIATNVAGTDVNITATWAAPAWTITNQYLFVQVAWKRTGAGGMTTTNIRLRTGSSTTVGTTGLTANFVPGDQAVTTVHRASTVVISGTEAVTLTSPPLAGNYGSGKPGYNAAQTIIATSTDSMTSIEFDLAKVGTPTDSVYLEIRQGTQIGTLLATSPSYPLADLPTFPTWGVVKFVVPLSMTMDVGYWFGFFLTRTSESGSNYLQISNGSYPFGASYDNTGTQRASDFSFRVLKAAPSHVVDAPPPAGADQGVTTEPIASTATLNSPTVVPQAVTVVGAFIASRFQRYVTPFTVQAGQITGTLTQFPTYVNQTLARFKSVANGGHALNALGYDLIPFADAACTTPLYFDRLFYDPTTGQVEDFIRVPSAAVGTIIYYGSGDPAITTNQSNAQGLWAGGSGGSGVWHLVKNGAVTGADAINVTNGTITGATVSAAGGALFNGTTGKVTLPDSGTLLKPTVTFTITGIIRSLPTQTNPAAIFCSYNQLTAGNVAGISFGVNIDAASLHVLSIVLGQNNVTPGLYITYKGTTVVDDGNPHWFVIVGTGTAIRLYVDGSADQAVLSTGAAYAAPAYYTPTYIRIASEATDIGGTAVEGKFFPGVLDKIQFYSGSTKTQAWASATYANQSNQATFFGTTQSEGMSGGGAFPPTVSEPIGGGDQGVTTQPIASTAILRVATVVPQAVTITSGNRTAAAVVNVPTVTVGPVTAVGATIASTAALYTPEVAGTGGAAQGVTTAFIGAAVADTILDNFNRADESPLSGGGNWAANANEQTNGLRLVSQQVEPQVGLACASYWTAPFSGDATVVIGIAVLPTQSQYIRIGLYVNPTLSGGANKNSYLTDLTRSGTNYTLTTIRTIGVSNTTLCTAWRIYPVVGDLIAIERVGTTIKQWWKHDGVWIEGPVAATDTQYTGAMYGAVAIKNNPSDWKLDNFGTRGKNAGATLFVPTVAPGPVAATTPFITPTAQVFTPTVAIPPSVVRDLRNGMIAHWPMDEGVATANAEDVHADHDLYMIGTGQTAQNPIDGTPARDFEADSANYLTLTPPAVTSVTTAFIGTVATDNFNRANEDPLSNGWAAAPAIIAGQLRIVGGAATTPAAASGGSYWTTLQPADFSVSVQVAWLAANGNCSIQLLTTPAVAPRNGFQLLLQRDASGTTYYLSVLVLTAGSPTTLIAQTAIGMEPNGGIGIKRTGTTIEVWWRTASGDWTLMTSATSASHAGALYASLNGSLATVFDNFVTGPMVRGSGALAFAPTVKPDSVIVTPRPIGMGAGSATITENFNRADEASLVGNWATATVSSATGLVLSSQLVTSPATTPWLGASYLSAGADPANFSRSVEIPTANTADANAIVAIEMLTSPTAAPKNGYTVTVQRFSGTPWVRVHRIDNGVLGAVVVAYTSTAMAADGAIAITRNGSSIEGWYRVSAASAWISFGRGFDTLYPGALYATLSVTNGTNFATTKYTADNFGTAPVLAVVGASLFAPTVVAGAASITGAHIPTTQQLFAPSLTTGPVSVTTGIRASAAVLNAPSLAVGAVAVTTGNRAAAALLNPPTVTPFVSGATIVSGNQRFAPTVALTLTTGTITTTSQVFTPIVGAGVITDTIASTLIVRVPTVTTGPVPVTTAFIASASTASVPSIAVGPASVTSGTRPSAVVVNAPSVASTVVGATRASALVVFPPSVTTTTTVTTGTCATTLQVFIPTVALAAVQGVTPVFIASALQMRVPSVTTGPVPVTGAFITPVAVSYAPSVAPGAVFVGGVHRATTQQVFAPSVAPGAVTVTTSALASTAQLFTPTLTAIAADAIGTASIGSTAVANAPTVVGGLAIIGAQHIGSTSVARIPSVAPGPVTIAGVRILSTALLFALAVAPGPVTITGATAAATQLFVPSVAVAAITNVGAVTIPTSSLTTPPSVAPGPVTVLAATRPPTTVLEPPSVNAGGITVGAGTRLSTAQVFAPVVAPGTVTVGGVHRPTTAQLFAPSLTSAITNAFIGATNQRFAPSVAPTVTTAFITSTLQMRVPSVAAGAVTVVGGTVASGSLIFEPSVLAGGTPVSGGHRPSTTALFPPSFVATLDGTFIVSTAQLFAPTVKIAQFVTTVPIPSGVVPFAPSVLALWAVGGATRPSTVLLFAPSVTVGPVTVVGGNATSQSLLFPPTVLVGGVAVTTAPIASTALLRAPTVGAVVVTAPIGAATQVFALSVFPGPVAVQTAPLLSTHQVFAPTLGAGITTSFVARTSLTYAPTLIPLVTTPLWVVSTVVYTPGVATLGELYAEFIPSGSVLLPPFMVAHGPPSEILDFVSNIVTAIDGTVNLCSGVTGTVILTRGVAMAVEVERVVDMSPSIVRREFVVGVER